jgi:serine-type D-Ala-D-Ala carboxypeptidase/endopeptidase (penicillin-binding protein 4)
VAGRHGSMSKVGKGTFIGNNLRAKTGYIHRVRTYCGFVTSRSGRLLAFSVIFNNYNCSATVAREVIEKWMAAVAEL